MTESTKHVGNRYVKILAAVLVVYMLFTVLFYWASGEQLFFRQSETKPITAKNCAAVMTDGTRVWFALTPETEYLDRISLLVGTYGKDNQGELVMQVFDEDGQLLSEAVLATSGLVDYVYQDFIFDTPLSQVQGEQLNVVITARNVPQDQGVSLWYGTEINAGKFTIPDMNGHTFQVNGAGYDGKICYSMVGRNTLKVGHIYWYLTVAVGLLLAAYTVYNAKALQNGKRTLVTRVIYLYRRYSFLIRQLVARDFKRKYKRSALGVLWSFLNPLMTMLVQYFVFSTIFKSSIENFIVYLLSGIIIFNFFGESIGLGLGSIVENAHLINKVYMPKEIYPVSRVLFSVINMVISLVPLFIVMLITGVPFTKSMLLIPIGLILLLLFCMGLSMLLSASMVFFRDTQFLWNIVSTLWQYLTPTFYPIDIIPEAWLPVYKLNPMYQFITFLRTILLEGMAPSAELYAGCFISAFVMLAIGYTVFRKNQDKFVMYL